MKTFITTLLLLISISSFSQTNSETQKQWRIGLTFSPDVFLNSTSVSTSENAGYSFNHGEFNFTSGVISQLSLNPKIELGTGIYYSNKDFTGTYYCHVCDFLLAPSPEIIKQRFIEIPLILRYNITNHEVKLHVEAGLKNSFLIDEVDTQYEGVLDIKKSDFSGQFGLGINKALGERLNFSLTTNYKHSLNDFSAKTDFIFRSIGVKSGLTYSL